MKGNRVDHPRKSSKDLADAVCGAIFGAISHTPKNLNQVVEIHTFRDRQKDRLDNMPDDVIKFENKPQEIYRHQLNDYQMPYDGDFRLV